MFSSVYMDMSSSVCMDVSSSVHKDMSSSVYIHMFSSVPIRTSFRAWRFLAAQHKVCLKEVFSQINVAFADKWHCCSGSRTRDNSLVKAERSSSTELVTLKWFLAFNSEVNSVRALRVNAFTFLVIRRPAIVWKTRFVRVTMAIKQKLWNRGQAYNARTVGFCGVILYRSVIQASSIYPRRLSQFVY